MKQYIKVKFLNEGPYTYQTSGIQYNYVNHTEETATVELGDIVVAETKYGPAVGQVTEICFDTCLAHRCRIYEILKGPYASKKKREYIEKVEKVLRKAEITAIKDKINKIIGKNDALTLACIITGDGFSKSTIENLSSLLKRLEELKLEDEDEGLPF